MEYKSNLKGLAFFEILSLFGRLFRAWETLYIEAKK
jgi:hypothetical protein